MKWFKIALLMSISWHSFGLTIIQQPGCYEVSGKYLGFKNGLAKLQVEPGRRGEHVLALRFKDTPKNISGLKVKAKFIIDKTGLTSKLKELQGIDIETLTPEDNIHSSWMRVGDENKCNHI
jgi:hypothetical protein